MTYRSDLPAPTTSSAASGGRQRKLSRTGLRKTLALQLSRLLRLRPLVPIRLVWFFCFVLFLLSLPYLRYQYTRRWPNKSFYRLQDPIWWTKPWTLPASSFPKVSTYPDIDWNPHPLWMTEKPEGIDSHPKPSSVKCNDESHPFHVDDKNQSSPLLFMGIFSTVERSEQRMIIRRRQLPHYNDSNTSTLLGLDQTHGIHPFGDMGIPVGTLESHFILGYPRGWSKTVEMLRDGTLHREDPELVDSPLGIPQSGLDSFVTWQGREVEKSWWRRWMPFFFGWGLEKIEEARRQIRVMHEVAEEQAKFGDLALLDLEDNIVQGKTYRYMRWLAQTRSQDRPPRFVMKTDDDTFLILPNLLSALSNLSCSTSYYIGNSWGCAQTFPFHFGGLGYILSWPLVAWIGGGGKELNQNDQDGNEDARMGAYFMNLDREEEPVVTLDYSIQMGSWFDDITFPKTTSTLAVHYMKEPNAYRDYSSKMWDIWHREGKEWRWQESEAWVKNHSSSLGSGQRA